MKALAGALLILGAAVGQFQLGMTNQAGGLVAACVIYGLGGALIGTALGRTL